MLEKNVKPRTIIVERENTRNKWVKAYTQTTANEPFTLDYLYNLVRFHEDNNQVVRILGSKGDQLLTGRGGLDFCRQCDYSNLISIIDGENHYLFSPNNSHYSSFRDLQSFIQKHKGILKYKIRKTSIEDGYLETGNIHFMDGTICSVAFYS